MTLAIPTAAGGAALDPDKDIIIWTFSVSRMRGEAVSDG